MSAGKIFLYGALGISAVLLLTTGKAKEVREDIQDKAIKNAKKWKDRLTKVSTEALNKLHNGQTTNAVS